MRFVLLILCGAILICANCASKCGTGPLAGAVCDPDDGVCKCGGQVCGPDDHCDLASQRCVSPLCSAGTAWTPGAKAFEEETERWGLYELGVEGIRLSVTDFDQDGYPDLSVRRGGNNADDFSASGTRASWLLRNVAGAVFEDVTQRSGLVAPRSAAAGNKGRPGEVVVWADEDNDGDLDASCGTSHTNPDIPQFEARDLPLLATGAVRTLGRLADL